MNILLRLLLLAAVTGQLAAQQALAQAPTAGLIHQWHFDEGKGNIGYDHIGSWDFQFQNGVTFSNGINNSGVLLDGADDFLLTGSGDTTFLNSDFSLTFAEKYINFVYKPGILQITSGRQLNLSIDLDYKAPYPWLTIGYAYDRFQQSQISLGDGFWHLISVIRSGNTTALYIDSTQVARAGTAFGTTGSGVFSLGKYDSHTFGGQLDEVSIYNRALSPAEIAQAAAAVPEPSATLLLSTPLGILALRRRSR